MICPYCLIPIRRTDNAQYYGRHKVHAGCQKWHVDNGLPYLLSGGEMKHHDHILAPDVANAMLNLYARHARYQRSH